MEDVISARAAREKLRAAIDGIKKLVNEQKDLLRRMQLVYDRIAKAQEALPRLLARSARESLAVRSPDFTDGDIMTMALLLMREEYLADQADLKAYAERIKRLMLEKKDVGLRVQRVFDQINQTLVARRTRRHWP